METTSVGENTAHWSDFRWLFCYLQLRHSHTGMQFCIEIAATSPSVFYFLVRGVVNSLLSRQMIPGREARDLKSNTVCSIVSNLSIKTNKQEIQRN